MSTIAGRKKSIISTSGVSIDQPVANKTLLNQAASESLYQQCSRLRARLLRIPSFVPYFALASPPETARQSTDPVTQLWDCLALGVPLVALYNLMFGDSQEDKLMKIPLSTSPDTFDVTNDKLKKHAIALFSMKARATFPGCEMFNITELVGSRETSDGFTKVVRIVSAMIDRIPSDVFEDTSSPPPSIAPSESSDSLVTGEAAVSTTLSAKERDRNNILREMLETERKYVQDLEVMQKYAAALSSSLDGETIHLLFPNLRQLLNFQRTFLIRFEGIAEVPWKDQRWGAPFVEKEQDFLVYEPYCGNYNAAMTVMLSIEPDLAPYNNLIHAKSELPAFLIKPVQRVCKYPLLLESLIKATPKDEYPWYDELVEGLNAAKRITDKINEAQRRAENLVAVENLRDRVEDWKGHAITNFGELILDDIFMVTKSDVDREYHVFMFDKIILCCKEVMSMPMSARKMSKSNSILKKAAPVTPTPSSLPGGVGAPKMKNTPLLLKGRIFLTNVTQAVPSRTNGYSLAVWWSGEDDMEYFTLRCRTEEQMVKWENALNKLIKDVADRRASERMSDSRARSIVDPSPQARMPSTYYDRSMTMSTMSMSGRTGSSAGRTRPVTPFGEDFVSGNYSRSTSDNFFVGEDDDEGYSPALNAAPSGRGTPLGSRRIANRTPLGYNEEARQSNYSAGTPPVPPVVNGLPAGPASRTVLSRPSISRLSSTASGNSSDGGARRGGLRNQFSSTRLNSAYGDGGGDSRSSMPASRPNGSNGTASARSRSASNPSAYVPRQAQPPPPLPNMGNWTQDSAETEEDGSKRGSGSSQSTQHSSDFSNNGGASSPATPYASSDGSLNAFEQPIKVKVHFNEDIFIVHVTPRVEFAELVLKVGKKIRLCGPRRDDGPLRVRYRDEDGDMVSLGSTEDVQMAFESVRPGGQVVLFVA